MLALVNSFLAFASTPTCMPAEKPKAVCFTGCSPYTEPPFPTWSNMVQEMAKECSLLVHLGDTKSGSGVCNDTLMAEPIRIMARTGVPTLYSLGDNEATDCHRMKSRGDYTSRGGSPCTDSPCTYPRYAEYYTAEGARTHMINQFFQDTSTDITGTLPVHTQSSECPFNVMVEMGGMLTVTIEMPGSNFGLSNEPNMEFVDPFNNSAGSHVAMYHRANDCNLPFISQAAASAHAHGIKAVLIGFHARWWIDPPNGGTKHWGYDGFMAKMLEVTSQYPDIMFYTIHADSHYWITFSPGYTENWVNLMVEGSTRGLTSFASFTIDPEHPFDPVHVKEVHKKLNEGEAATYGR